MTIKDLSHRVLTRFSSRAFRVQGSLPKSPAEDVEKGSPGSGMADDGLLAAILTVATQLHGCARAPPT